MSLGTYDPASVVVNVGGISLEGFANGTFVTASRSGDSYIDDTGADNRTTRIKQNDKSGSIVVTLSQSSPSNDYLSGLALLDETTGDGVVPVTVKDLSGTTLWFTPTAWIKAPSPGAFGKAITNREWTFRCADLMPFTGGNK